MRRLQVFKSHREPEVSTDPLPGCNQSHHQVSLGKKKNPGLTALSGIKHFKCPGRRSMSKTDAKKVTSHFRVCVFGSQYYTGLVSDILQF